MVLCQIIMTSFCLMYWRNKTSLCDVCIFRIIMTILGKFEHIKIPCGTCETCNSFRKTTLKDFLRVNLFPGNPSPQLHKG